MTEQTFPLQHILAVYSGYIYHDGEEHRYFGKITEALFGIAAVIEQKSYTYMQDANARQEAHKLFREQLRGEIEKQFPAIFQINLGALTAQYAALSGNSEWNEQRDLIKQFFDNLVPQYGEHVTLQAASIQ